MVEEVVVVEEEEEEEEVSVTYMLVPQQMRCEMDADA